MTVPHDFDVRPAAEFAAPDAGDADMQPDTWRSKLPEFEKGVVELLPGITGVRYAWLIRPLALTWLLEGYSTTDQVVDLVASKFVTRDRRRPFRKHAAQFEIALRAQREQIVAGALG